MRPENIVFVNEDGTPTGEIGSKLESHTAYTRLHLAFSCYVFDKSGKFLATRRALSKKVWPGVWTNSVCGHPAPSEDIVDAIKRRLDYELGMAAADFNVAIPDYKYKTPPYNGIIENEFCPVYVARATSVPQPNPEEVEDLWWMTWQDFVHEVNADNADRYSWWCKDQMKQLENHLLIRQYTNIA